ncbi:MAG: mycothiol system anti-sigma-R factor [Actinomycetia bacterium]|nr:mycothiol system anti-sigma-R factor [Actinomycetes bacterium]
MTDTHDHRADGDPDCEGAVAQLYEYLDGELQNADMDTVAEHLQRCSPCLEAFDFHAELRRVVASKCAEEMPAELRSKLLHVADRADTDGPG